MKAENSMKCLNIHDVTYCQWDQEHAVHEQLPELFIFANFKKFDCAALWRHLSVVLMYTSLPSSAVSKTPVLKMLLLVLTVSLQKIWFILVKRCCKIFASSKIGLDLISQLRMYKVDRFGWQVLLLISLLQGPIDLGSNFRRVHHCT